MVQFPELLDELLNYGIDRKAEIVFWKCVRRKKYELASKIASKYRIKLQSTHDDTVMASQMAAQAQKELKDK